MFNFTESLLVSGVAKKGTGRLKTPSRELLFDKKWFGLVSVQTLARWNIDHLHILNITGEKLGVEENKTLIRILKDYCGTLREVNLQDVKLDEKMGQTHSSSLLLALDLEYSLMSSNRIELFTNSLNQCTFA